MYVSWSSARRWPSDGNLMSGASGAPTDDDIHHPTVNVNSRMIRDLCTLHCSKSDLIIVIHRQHFNALIDEFMIRGFDLKKKKKKFEKKINFFF